MCVWGGGGRIEPHNLQGGNTTDLSKSTTNSLPGVGFGGKTCGVHVAVVVCMPNKLREGTALGLLMYSCSVQNCPCFSSCVTAGVLLKLYPSRLVLF